MEKDRQPGGGPGGEPPDGEASRPPGEYGPVRGTAGGAARASEPEDAEVRSASWKDRTRGRRVLAAAGAVFLVLLAVGAVLWFRCGVAGCPDVDMLRGYMPDEASVVVDRNGDEIAKLFVTRRVYIGLDSLPKHVGDAFIAIEDQRFWDHGGVDVQRVFGAMLQNVRSGGVQEGASTITMQLARNIFPDDLPANEKTVWRKVGEARVARQIEGRYTKQEILELYLNQIYFGEGAWGIEAAAQEYYGKSATELDLAEAATLAALPRAPSRLNPRVNPELARTEREVVLNRMRDQGLISSAEHQSAAEEELTLRRGDRTSDERAPYFVESVRRILEEQLGDAIYTRGYRIHTTLDLAAQSALEEQLAQQARRIEAGTYGGYRHATYASAHADSNATFERGTPYLQTAGIVMDAHTGDVIALVGGRDYNDSKFNRAMQAMRQPGSAFKPFVFAAAISAGYSPSYQLVDQPIRLMVDRNRSWEPKNYGNSYAGVISLRNALVQSKNVATVRLSGEVGLSRIIGLAEQVGLGRIASNPAVVLGTSEVTPVQLAQAYTPFATLGQRTNVRLIERVVDRDGRTVWAQQPSSQRVLSPSVAFITNDILQDVVDRGTGAGVRGSGFRGPAGGKTGTTQDAADVWFVGFTPEYVGVIWYGLDKRARILTGATGGEIAAPVWGRVMRQVATSSEGWTQPAGVETREVDETGSIVGAGCPTYGATHTEYFLAGTAPIGECYRDPSYYQTWWQDSLGTDPYDSLYAYPYDTTYSYPYDTTSVSSEERDRFWDRLRSRVFGEEEDSLNVRQSPETTIDTAPATRTERAQQRQQPTDTTSNPPILGEPVRREPPPDSGTVRQPL